MKRTPLRIVIPALAAALLGTVLVVWAIPRFKKIEKRGSAPESVATVVTGDVKATAASIAGALNDWTDLDQPGRAGSYQNKFPSGSQWSRLFLFRRDDATNRLFPLDEEILRNRGDDSFVQRYVKIAPELRTMDFYLYEPSGDGYWASEYFYKGQPAPFRCSFFIHLEPAGDSGTRVEIFEYQPEIWAGEYWGLSAHAILPTTLRDIRPVETTNADRKALLALIQGAVQSSRQAGAH